jgi:leader peptidase (prepilin peptidase)/N-methyltransferase
MLDAFLSWNELFLLGFCLLGLAVGGGLSKMLYRLPIAIRGSNEQVAREILGLPDVRQRLKGFVYFKSYCPLCHKLLPFWYTIPLFGYLALRGHSRCCRKKISLCYPLIECLSALCSTLLAWQFGLTFFLGGSLVLTWALLLLAFIDLRTLLLPDQITLPILWLGLLINTLGLFTSAKNAILGAIIGFLGFYLISFILLKIKKTPCLGEGDLKLAALLGAWFGWRPLLLLILIASLMGSIMGLAYLIARKKSFSTLLPFGPFLSSAAFIMLLGGKSLLEFPILLF